MSVPWIPKPPKTPQDTYWVVRDPDDMATLRGPYATRALATKFGPIDLGLKSGEVYWTGRAECSAVREVLKLAGHADLLIDSVRDGLEDLLGDEIPDDWTDKMLPEQKVELEETLSRQFILWLSQNGHYPQFFIFEDERKETFLPPRP